MEKIKLILIILCLSIFSSCVDTEELIVINKDNSGTYTIIGDMGKFFQLAKSFGNKGVDDGQKDKNQDVDTTVFLKDIINQVEYLSASEKELYKNGTYSVKISEKDNEFKMVVSCPFANLEQLQELKKNLFTVVDKLSYLSSVNKFNNDQSVLELEPEEHKEAGKIIFPFSDQYIFSVQKGIIENNIIDINAFKEKLQQDSTQESLNALKNAFSDSYYKTTIVRLK